MNRTLSTVAASVGLGILVATLPSAASAQSLDERQIKVAGWAPYWANTYADEAVNSSAGNLDEVLPFWYTVKTANGKPYIVAQTSEQTIQTYTKKWKNKNLTLIASVTDSTGARKMASILSNKTSRTNHINDLVSLAEKYDGIDLDYETFAFSDGTSTWATTQIVWIKFISELSTKLHEQNKLLSVTTPPMYSDTSGYWVYAHKAILPKVDYLRIMAYDYSVSNPGPIAPINWVKNLLNYELSINKDYNHKIWLGIPTYGRSWAQSNCPAGVGADTSTKAFLTRSAAAGNLNAEYKEHTASSSSTYSWKNSKNKTKTCQIIRTAWWLTDEDIASRIDLAAKKEAGGVVFWTLGGHSSKLWGLLEANRAPSRSKVKIKVTVTKKQGQHRLAVKTTPATKNLKVTTSKPKTQTVTGEKGKVVLKLKKLPKEVCVYTPAKICKTTYN